MNIQNAANISPSDRQYHWQKREFYAFIHFGMNTFSGKQWGNGKENPIIFNPTDFDAEQWVKAVKDAEMSALILTCKHHDGFCLWPSRYTEHSIRHSPYQNGKGNIVKEVSNACRKYGIAFGIYLSPWDRNSEYYGDSKRYNDYFVNQLTELLTEYGDIFCVWFDGACAEGPNGKKQIYDWNRYYDTIRELQPDAVISVCGPDVRWCGNEAGDCRKSEWSVVPAYISSNEKTAEKSQQNDTDAFIHKKLDTMDHDLGSRKVIENVDKLIWYPAEVNTSIRPNWFYDPIDDNKIRSLHNLIMLYESSVGGNSTLLLNLPPDQRGLIHENDTQRLHELGEYLRNTFHNDLAENARISADESQTGHDVQNILSVDEDLFWKPLDFTEKAVITLEFENEIEFSHIVLMEHIRTGQRIERFDLYADEISNNNKIYEGTVIGYKKICAVHGAKVKKLIVNITESRICPTLMSLHIYNAK